jgi:hypothetical protein
MAAPSLTVLLPCYNVAHIAFNATIVDVAGRPKSHLRVHSGACTDDRVSRAELVADAAAMGERQSCLRVYRRSLFDLIGFPPRRFYEDAAVLPEFYARARVIENLDERLYVYRQRPGSITSRITAKHVEDLLLNIRESAVNGEDASRATYWNAVREKMLMHVAREIGRAPRSLRVALATRTWRQVRSGSPLSVRRAWRLQLLNGSMRTGAKALMRRGAALNAAAD